MTLAIVFPGQGSQSVGMLAELASQFPQVEQTFAQASTALGYDLWQLVQAGPADQLNQTDKTQPAMLAAGVAVWRVWQANGGGTPLVMAGHSLGEYTALVCAGALDFADAVRLVADRGRYMQDAVPPGTGAMAAVLGLDDYPVRAVCAQAQQGDVVEAVNFNSPGQVVIAGQVAAVNRAIELAKAAGAKRAVLLPVSVPSHCALMKPAALRLADRLHDLSFAAPRISVINNVDVSQPDDPAQIKAALVRQLYSPVRWVETVQAMARHGVTKIIEAGPGKVLAGLNKRIVKDIETYAVFDPSTLATARSST